MSKSLEEVRRSAREHSQSTRDARERELQMARQKAHQDLDGWVRDIQRYMQFSKRLYLSLDTISSKGEWQHREQRELTPSVDVDDIFSMGLTEIKEYADELGKLLGPPFRVETNYELNDGIGYNTFKIWWT
jgi:hypothetical protein